MIIRELEREEIEKIWSIDRSEVIDAIYYLENKHLVLKPEYYNLQEWPPGEPEKYTPILQDCFDRGGAFYGAFEGSEMAGVVVLESRFIGNPQDQLQLKFLEISKPYRKKGLGRKLFEKAVNRARDMKAKRLYISATPSKNTINFYLYLGCTIADEIDPELYELEPEDIHMEYLIV